MLGFIIRNTVGFTNVDSLLVLYYSFIRSKLEYSSVVWDPYYKIHISSIERIQRKFCKHLFYVKFGRYPVRTCSSVVLFNEFNLYSLKDRRTVANIIFLHKLIHGKIFSQNLLGNLSFHIPRLNCRYTGTFAIDWCRTNQHFYSPLYNMCRSYNNIAPLADIFLQNIKHFTYLCKNAVLTPL